MPWAERWLAQIGALHSQVATRGNCAHGTAARLTQGPHFGAGCAPLQQISRHAWGFRLRVRSPAELWRAAPSSPLLQHVATGVGAASASWRPQHALRTPQAIPMGAGVAAAPPQRSFASRSKRRAAPASLNALQSAMQKVQKAQARKHGEALQPILQFARSGASSGRHVGGSNTKQNRVGLSGGGVASSEASKRTKRRREQYKRARSRQLQAAAADADSAFAPAVAKTHSTPAAAAAATPPASAPTEPARARRSARDCARQHGSEAVSEAHADCVATGTSAELARSPQHTAPASEAPRSVARAADSEPRWRIALSSWCVAAWAAADRVRRRLLPVTRQFLFPWAWPGTSLAPPTPALSPGERFALCSVRLPPPVETWQRRPRKKEPAAAGAWQHEARRVCSTDDTSALMRLASKLHVRLNPGDVLHVLKAHAEGAARRPRPASVQDDVKVCSLP